VLALALLAPSAAAGPFDRPDAINQPLADGCQRNPAGLLTFSSPEWVYVYNGNHDSPRTRVVEGVAHATSPAGEDLPQNHASYDLDSNVQVDKPYEYLLGGDPAAKNGNFGEGGEDTGRIHVEWESTVLPPWAWPTEGDRVKLWGPWIWDCGHWGQGTGDPDYFLPGNQPGSTPDNLRGEQTEIHPMQALVVTRANPYSSAAPESETDAFLSSDGTKAYGEEKCTEEHPAPPSTIPGVTPSYGPDWTACVATTTHQKVNDRRYTFFVPAPPKPSASAVLRYREVQMAPAKGGPVEDVVVKPDGLEVGVEFSDHSDTADMQYGRSFFVGWEGDKRRVEHLVLEPRSLDVVHSLDPNPQNFQQATAPPGEWVVFLDANGYWRLLDDWAPGLLMANDGQSFAFSQAVDLFVPEGKPVRVLVNPRECDLPQMVPCAQTSEVAGGNDHPGDALATFPSADAALGTHTIRPGKREGADSPDYAFTFNVRRGASVGCIDLNAPRARFTRVRLGRHSVSARGTASDVGCGPVAGRVRRVQVAVAAHVPGGCRFLSAKSKLGRRVDCHRRVWLPVRGTTSWRFSRRAALPRGRYVILVRGIDRVGNVQHLQTRANVKRPRLR
jgi:hypothetical protein